MLTPPIAMSNSFAAMSCVRFAQIEGMKIGGFGRERALERDWAMVMSAPM